MRGNVVQIKIHTNWKKRKAVLGVILLLFFDRYYGGEKILNERLEDETRFVR